MRLKDREFDLEDQYQFAKASGDNNPMHIDASVARRMLFGGPVVHGMNLLLWGLDNIFVNCKDTFQLVSLHVSFNKAIGLGETVVTRYKRVSGYKVKIFLISNNAIKTIIKAEWCKSEPFCKEKDDYNKPDKAALPKLLTKENILNKFGNIELCSDKSLLEKLFPNLTRCLHPEQLVSLITLSRLVGTECPGLNSLFSGLDLSICKSKQQKRMEYKVVDFDERVNMISIHVDSAMLGGIIKTFIRPEPFVQESYLFHTDIVKNNEFADQNALVLGGSRGLGEVTCKLLAAGNANVVATYAKGKNDARRIEDEIVLKGGDIKFVQCDVLNNSQFMRNAKIKDESFTHLYYFPTPFIFSGEMGVLSKEIFYEFCKYYVTEFFEIVDNFASKGLNRILYPSSIAIEEIPLNMSEYAIAKSAGEALCVFLEKKYTDLIIYRPRLPRMATDQTVTIFPVKNEHPSYVMYDHLLKMSTNDNYS